MVETAGLTRTSVWSCNFEPLFRLANKLSLFDTLAPLGRRINLAVGTCLALASFPVEWFCHALPLTKPTHSVMMFRK